VRRTLLGHLFIAPWIGGFLAVSLYPMAMSLYYGFTRYDILTPPR
jgi:multiple sugar transport system permease protein